jgi:hypothetical protein
MFMFMLSDTERTKAAHDDVQSRVDILHFANKNSQSISYNVQPRNSRQSLITEKHEISVVPAQVLLNYATYTRTKRRTGVRLPRPWEFRAPRGYTNLLSIFSVHRHTPAVINMRSNSTNAEFIKQNVTFLLSPQATE